MDATDKLNQAVFDDKTRTAILGNIDKQEIMHDLVKTNVDSTGVEVMDCVMRQVANQINTMGIAMKYEKILQQSENISSALEFKSIAKMWNWNTPDQAGFNNAQKPDAVYQMTVHNNRMYLFVEVDGDSKSDQPQVTAMKLWQSVTFGRVRKSDMSVGSLRINMDSMPKADVQHHLQDNPQPTPSEIYEWLVDIVRACVFVVGNFIAHNLRHDTLKKFQRHSRWSQVLGTQDDTGIPSPNKSSNIYDMHFFVGVYDTQFYSKCSTGHAIPLEKQVNFGLYDYKKQYTANVLDGATQTVTDKPRNNYYGDITKYKSKCSEFYRPTSTLESKIDYAQNNNDIYDSDNICLKVDFSSTVYHGEETGHGANINYIFMQRVNQRDIDDAVTELSQKSELQDSPEAIRTRFAKVHGLWYLQDMFHFLDRARADWGSNFEKWLAPIFDADGITLKDYDPARWRGTLNVFGTAPPPYDYHKFSFPKGWQMIDSKNSYTPNTQNAREVNIKTNIYFTVYQFVLESFVAEMENVYHGLIDDVVPNPSWGINSMSKKIKQIKQKHNRNVLEVKQRVDNTISVTVRPGENLRHRVLFAAKQFLQETPLEQELVKYLTQYKSEYMELFCRMIQCQTMLGLIEIAHNYTQNPNNTLIERDIASFTPGVQSEIRFMLRSVASNNQLLMRNTTFDPAKVTSLRDTPPILQRVDGGFIFGSKPSKTTDDNWAKETSVVLSTKYDDVWDCLRQSKSAEGYHKKANLLHQFTLTDAWQYKYWFRQDYLKGVNGADRHGLLQILDELHSRVGLDINQHASSCDVTVSYHALLLPWLTYIRIQTFVTHVQQLFSVEVKAEHDSCIPVLFYSRILWVCRAIALDSISLAGVDELSDERVQNRKESWNERYDKYPNNDFTTVTENGTKGRISETLAFGIMAVEGMHLLTSNLTLDPNDYGSKERKLLRQLHTLLSNPDGLDANELPQLNTAKMQQHMPGVLQQNLPNADMEEIIHILLDLDDGNLTKIGVSEFEFENNTEMPNNEITAPQLGELRTWLPRLGQFMRFQCGFVLAEIEVVIKGLIINCFIARQAAEQTNRTIKQYLDINPHATNKDIAKTPPLNTHAAQHAGIYLPGVQSRSVMFPQSDEEWTLSSYASLRDFNLIRRNHFYRRLETRSGINVKVIKTSTETLYVQVNQDTIANVYGATPAQLPMFKNDPTKSKYLSLEPEEWKQVFEIVRKTLAGNTDNELLSLSFPKSAMDGQTHAMFDHLADGTPANLTTTVHAAAETYTISLYQDPNVDKLDTQEKSLWDSLYKHCCLKHMNFEYNDIEPILKDYRTIEDKHVQWYKKLEHDTKGYKKTMIMGEDVTVPVCQTLTLQILNKQVKEYDKFKCPHQKNQATNTDNYVKCQKCSKSRLDFIHQMSTMTEREHELRFEILWKWKFLAMARVRMIWAENGLYTGLDTWANEDLFKRVVKNMGDQKSNEPHRSWLRKQLQSWNSH